MKRVNRIEAVCPQCGEQFKLKRYLAKKPTKYGRFCSMECRGKYVAKYNPASQRKRVRTECAFCGKELWLQARRILERNFCSHSCRGKYGCAKRWKDHDGFITVICAFCGSEKRIRIWDYNCSIKRGQQQFFCDRQCFGKWKSANWCLENNPSWKGGWTPHGIGWRIISEQIRKEQKYKCADCDISQDKLGRKLDVHHIVPARLFKRKADACIRPNLIALCHKCHMARENGF